MLNKTVIKFQTKSRWYMNGKANVGTEAIGNVIWLPIEKKNPLSLKPWCRGQMNLLFSFLLLFFVFLSWGKLSREKYRSWPLVKYKEGHLHALNVCMLWMFFLHYGREKIIQKTYFLFPNVTSFLTVLLIICLYIQRSGECFPGIFRCCKNRKSRIITENHLWNSNCLLCDSAEWNASNILNPNNCSIAPTSFCK